MSKKRECALRKLLEFHCAYCGYSKSVRPPTWCVRSHEVYDAKQRDLKAALYDEERA